MVEKCSAVRVISVVDQSVDLDTERDATATAAAAAAVAEAEEVSDSADDGDDGDSIADRLRFSHRLKDMDDSMSEAMPVAHVAVTG